MATITYKGTVKGNIVILESDAAFPEGAEVEVKILESKPDLAKRKAAVLRLTALGEKLKGRNVNLSKHVLEAKAKLERGV